MDVSAVQRLPPNPVQVAEVAELCASDLRSKLQEIGRLDRQIEDSADPSSDDDKRRVLDIARIKVELAHQGYEAVERCIREIDQSLQSAEGVIRNRLFCLKGVASVRRATRDEDAGDGDLAQSVDEYPSEPVYCTCRKVQFGNMVACDDDSCEIEWYHYDCVGLKTAPKGKWYCPTCRSRRSSAAAAAQTATLPKTPGSVRGRRRRQS